MLHRPCVLTMNSENGIGAQTRSASTSSTSAAVGHSCTVPGPAARSAIGISITRHPPIRHPYPGPRPVRGAGPALPLHGTRTTCPPLRGLLVVVHVGAHGVRPGAAHEGRAQGAVR